MDGDFSDWPADMRRYPIRLPEFGAGPRNGDDFTGHFRIGYDAAEKALYLPSDEADAGESLGETIQFPFLGLGD